MKEVGFRTVPKKEKALCDGMYLAHDAYILHLMDNGWNRADAEVRWDETEHYLL